MEKHAEIFLGDIVPHVFRSKTLITWPNTCLLGN